MHFHTREGSIDGKVGVNDALNILKYKGYDGVLITDHNSYSGYNAVYNESEYGLKVLCGMEYDTVDGGHCLIILPDRLQLSQLTEPGLRIEEVIELVHSVGGVIGLSHPYDCSRLGFMNASCKNKEKILKDIDFIEGVNASSFKKKNDKAMELAKKLNKPIFSGSDSHKKTEVGKGSTEVRAEITSNRDLIELVKRAGFNTFLVADTYRKPSKLEKILQFRVNIGGFCWLWYIKLMYLFGGRR